MAAPIHLLLDISAPGLAGLIHPVLPRDLSVRIVCRERYQPSAEGPVLVVCWGDAFAALARWPGHPGFGVYDLASPLACLLEGLLALTRGAKNWFCPVSQPSALAFQRLPPRQRQVFALHASGLRLKDIAARLGLKPQTVSEHLRRARLHLECGDPAPLSRARPGARIPDGRQAGLPKAAPGRRTPNDTPKDTPNGPE